MPAWMRHCVYVAAGACLASGVLWLLFHHFVRRESEFGPQSHPLEHVWLTVHGAAALALTWVFGLIWLAHVRRGWQRGRNRQSGVTMAILLAALAVTGCGLYYLGEQTWRDAMSQFHWLAGLAGGLWLPMHIWRGRRTAMSPERVGSATATHGTTPRPPTFAIEMTTFETAPGASNHPLTQAK